jgi:hypothetical protein
MNALGRIPFWAWYLFSVAYCYAIWNPWFSVSQLMTSGADPAIKVFAIIVVMIIGSLYIVEGHRTLNVFGIILFLALFGSIMWLAFNHGFRGFNSIYLWGQWVVGLLLTIAVQGGKLYRSLTGRVPVGAVIDDHHDGVHHG